LPYPEYSETGHFNRVLQTSGTENPPDVVWDDLIVLSDGNNNSSADIIVLCAPDESIHDGEVTLYGGTGSGDAAIFTKVFPSRYGLSDQQQGLLTVTHYDDYTDELSWTNLSVIPILPGSSQDEKVLLATIDCGSGTEANWITLTQLKAKLNALP